jgi:hypothetical protein
MKHMIYAILDVANGKSFPLYVGRGRTRYGDGRRKSWSRIDIHKRELQKALEVDDPELIRDSLYCELVKLIRAGARLEFRVLKEMDSDAEAVVEEAKATDLYKSLNPQLLNVMNIAGGGMRPNRRRNAWSDEDRAALSARMTGKIRGPYTMSDEGRRALQDVANANRKKLNLSPEQAKERVRKRAEVHRRIRQIKKLGQDIDSLVQELGVIDAEYGVIATYVPKAYSTRPRATMSLEEEGMFLDQFGGQAKISDVQAAFELKFNKSICTSGAYAMMCRHNVARSRSRG